MLAFSMTDQIGDFFYSRKRIKGFCFIRQVILSRGTALADLRQTLTILKVFWPTLLAERFQLAITISESTLAKLLKSPPREPSQR